MVFPKSCWLSRRRVGGFAPLWRLLNRLLLRSASARVASGALLVSILVGFFYVTASNPVDQLGQGAASIVALALLAGFAWRIRRRERGVHHGLPLATH